MPIKLNVVDNNSSVRVKTKSNDEVRLQPDCGIDNARYEALVNKEKQERIAADQLLQETKQNKGYIQVEDYLVSGPIGQFDPETLELLKSYLVNKLSFNGYIYSLSITNGNKAIYFCPRETEYNKVEVDFTNGSFGLLKNNEHTVTQEQIDFWNNKVTAYAIGIEETINDNTLHLDRINTIDEHGNVVIK